MAIEIEVKAKFVENKRRIHRQYPKPVGADLRVCPGKHVGLPNGRYHGGLSKIIIDESFPFGYAKVKRIQALQGA